MAKGVTQLVKLFGIMFSLVLLAGCPAPSEDVLEGNTAVSLQPGVNLIMSSSATSERSNEISINDDAKVDIIFLDAAKAPLSNRIINVSATSGTLSQATVKTDLEGKTEVTINPPALTIGTAPGIFTATPVPESDLGDISEEQAALIDQLNAPKTMIYEFVATTVAETPDEAATFVSSLQFISAEPTFLSLKGTGGFGYGESSTLTFKVVDNENSPIAGVQVNFTLTTSVGGLALSTSSSLSNNDGEAKVTVLAGSVSTPVRVTASVTMTDGSLRSVQSDKLTVTTGIPDQDSFSLSMGKFAPEAWGHDGETFVVTARLGDHFNNPVPDGTVVNFTTEGGRIEASCETTGSECSVTWSSQDPRPVDGRVTILAYAIGNEYFSDPNGNGIFDNGDTFDDLGEVFRDDDESRTFNPSLAIDPTATVFSRDERLIDYNSDGLYTGPNGLYNGVPCDETTGLCPVDANNIAGRTELLVNIGASSTIIMASSTPRLHLYELLAGDTCLGANGKLVIDGVQCQAVSPLFGTGVDLKRFWVLIEDDRALCKTSANGDRIDGVIDPNDLACLYVERQSAPTGTTISVSTDVGTVVGIPRAVVPSQSEHLEFDFFIQSAADNTDAIPGNLEVTITPPVEQIGITVLEALVDPAN